MMMTSAGLLLLSALAVDLSGIWTGQLRTGRQDNPTADVAFQFVQQGTQLRGKLYGDYRSSPIVSGVVAGDGLVTFVVLSQEQAGNEINETRIRFTGRLTPATGELELVRERESSSRAGSGATAPPARINRQTLTLHRLGRAVRE